MNDRRREFCEVIDWDSYQYADIRKVPKPPWKWFRIPISVLRSAEYLSLTKPLRADFVALLGAASETGNLIPMDKRWLSARQITRNSIEKLSKSGLCRAFFLMPDDKRIRELRRVFSGVPPVPEGRGQIQISETEGANGATDHRARSDERSIDLSRVIRPCPSERKINGRKQPPFEDLVKACLLAKLRPSDRPSIAAHLEKVFRIQATERQLAHIERQLIDRSRL